MPAKTLFPMDNLLVADEQRIEPTLWIKQLVVLPRIDSDTPIRDISFRLGLNIVQTATRGPTERSVVGHSVGKTLLMRLIRYTLGESHYATENTRVRIRKHFEDAIVVAQWRVSGNDWVVVRPFAERSTSDSFAVQCSDYRIAVQSESDRVSFSEFQKIVSTSVLADLLPFKLPKADRLTNWHDVLGWLARDYECGYRSHNEWRHRDADSGKVHDRDDCSLILQWISGLMGKEEIALRDTHNELLSQRKTKRTERDDLARDLKTLSAPLFSKVGIKRDEESPPDKEGLFASKSSEQAKEMIASLNRLKGELQESDGLKSLEDQEAVADESLIEASVAVRDVRNRLGFSKGDHQQTSSSSNLDAFLRISPTANCRHPRCPKKDIFNKPPEPDPAHRHNLDELATEIESLQNILTDKIAIEKKCREAKAAIKNQIEKVKQERVAQLAELDSRIGRWSVYAEDSAAYTETRATLSSTERVIESLGTKIDDSYEKQKIAREQYKPTLLRISERYDAVLKSIFNDSATGRLVVDGNGLYPEPASSLAPTGAAMAIMTTVLGFDLAMVASSIAGLGHHPRFLLHDSPREGDMEEQLFHKLFQVAIDFEKVFGRKLPSFQYIVTTTTTAPDELIEANPELVRATFDAREEDSLLLRKAF